ncbi:MAG: DUF3560 domain-containing protein [Bacteroidota bacterium]
MKHNFHDRKANRIANAKKQAEKNEKLSEQLFNQAEKMASVIPFGQPILVGHHSEKSDRKYRNKIHNTFGRAFEAGDKAKYYEEKAETIESNTAISSDDPDALVKLKEKLVSLGKTQLFMKAANQCLRKKNKEGFLALDSGTEEMWEELNRPNEMGFPHYKFANNSAEIRRVKERIEQMTKIQALTSTETRIGDARIVLNVEANRVQILFDAIPAEEMRKKLKSNGFRWSPSQGAWQRHITNYAIYIAKQILTPSTDNKL